jgi:hypothetical protein
MTEPGYPVTVAVTRPDGSIEQVRVGTAHKSGDGFSLTMGELSIGGTQDKPGAGAPKRAASAGGGLVFPPYGRSKGAPIAGASQQDLEYYANGCRRTLGDPGKARFHEKEKALLAAIEAEIAKQGGGSSSSTSSSGPGEPPPPGDEDAPF